MNDNHIGNMELKVDGNLAKKVINCGEHTGDGGQQKDCYWRGYRFDNKCYVALCDGYNVWEVDENVMLSYCCEE